jgi:TatA/E family protein of Tat protein translocase
MLNIGPQELILVLIIALVVVGPSRLPELGRSIGKALREFRKIQDDVKDTIKFDLSDDEPYVPPERRPRPPAGNGEAAKAVAPPPTTTEIEPADPQTDVETGADDDAGPRAAE